MRTGTTGARTPTRGATAVGTTASRGAGAKAGGHPLRGTGRRRGLALLAGGATIALGLAVGPAGAADASTGTHRANAMYGGILHVAQPEVTIADNFNPLNPGGTGSTAIGTGSAIYEPLMYDNVYTGKLTPVLATGYRWSDGDKTLTLSIRSGVKWSDGKPFSASDVAFTFNYLKKYPALDVNGDWAQTPLVSVRATSPSTVVFRYRKADTVVLPFIVGQPIVPEHIFAKVADPTTFTNQHPVGTGPFLLQSYSPTQVRYVKNPHYWMPGRPYIDGITMTAVKSDDTAELLLLDGDAAYTYDAITDPARTYAAAHPAWNKYWWPVTELNFLYMNTEQAPFDNVAFRRAVAEALNDNVIAQDAYYGAIPPGNGAVETGVTNGQTSEWVPSSLSSLEWAYNPSAAAATLKAAGFRDVDGSLEGPQGNVLPTFKILVGSGWSDYISMAQTIGDELAPLGIHTVVDQETYSTYAAEADAGQYSFLISWSNGNNSTPYYEYHYLLEGSAPAGTDVTTNWERYSSPADTAALTQYSETSSLATQKADMAKIERDVLTNAPVISLTGRPNFFDYSARYFTGWPSASDPYNAGEAPDNFNGGAEQLYLNVHLK